MHTRRITRRDDLVVGENLISFDGAPRMYTVSLLEFRGDKSRMSASTSWTAGKRPVASTLAGQHTRGSTTARAAEPLT
jgi:hypothetical protein